MAESQEIGQSLVEHIAGLARLEIPLEELEAYRHHLQSMVEHFQGLEEIETEQVRPLSNPLREYESFYVGSLRDDLPAPSLGVEGLLENAPDSALNQFRVRAVIESED